MKQRKNILIVDNNSELEKLVREPLMKSLESSDVSPILVRAKDGADAAMKSENQKFDVVLIDTEVPRLMDGGFVYGIHSYKNTQNAELLVVSGRDPSQLPANLQSSKVFKKPVSPNELIEAMASVLNSQHLGAAKKGTATPAASTPKHIVDVRVINSIIKATTHVLQQFGCSTVNMEKAIQKSPQEPLMGEVSSVVDIKSTAFQGHLSVSFDKGSFLEVASAMLMEEQLEITPDNQDAVGEINNIIFGNAKAEITSYGVQLTVPKVLIGSNQTIPCDNGSAGMMIPFSTEKGKLYITVVAYPPGHAS